MTIVHQSTVASGLRRFLSRFIFIADVALLIVGGFLFAFGREAAVEVLLDDQGSERHAELGAESAVLDVDADGYARIVHRGEAHEGRVVVAAVLGRSGLSAHFDAGQVGPPAGAGQHGAPHAGHDIIIIARTDHRVAAFEIGGVELGSLYAAHHVRDVVVAAVGDSGGQVGYLQGRSGDLSLADGD